MDFVFGTLINDELKLANHRAQRDGIQHQHDISPVDPKPGEAVTVRGVTSSERNIHHVALYYTTDETIPQGSHGVASNGEVARFEKVKTEWDTLTWGYLTHWQASLPAQPEDTLVQYCISAWSEDGDEIYADWPNAEARLQHAAMIFFKNIPPDTEFDPGAPQPGHVFNYCVDTTSPPRWADDAIIYHIFIDRFYPGDGKEWRQTDDLNDVVGGTLWGVRDKLDYLAELGVNCLWLSPTWTSPTSHGYDVVDYNNVEPRLGGEEALRAVVDGAHQRGMRVLLDMACNHISNQHPYFVQAFNDPNSPYREWFFFDDRYQHGYLAFFNVATMPEVNLAHPAARDWMVGNAVRWLRDFDVDGYRLDYANGPGPDFWTYFRRACKAAKPDCLLFGEIIDAPNKLRHYIGRLDGCLDFPTNDALRRTYAWKTWDTAQMEAFARSHADYFSGDFVMPTFLDNHDMDRFSYVADNDDEALRQAVIRQFALPNPPIIYYGTEVGLHQTVSTREAGLHVSRVPMLWGDQQDRSLLNFYKQQIRARKGC